MLWPALAVGTEMSAILVWLGVVLHFAPSLIRLLNRDGNPWDRAGAFALLTGLVFIGYWLRWVVVGQHVVAGMPLLKWWVVANIAAIMLGLGSFFGFETVEVQRDNVRARSAIILWFAMTIACVGLAWAIQ